ncbi:MAG: hypothetical protein LBE65_05440 [Synergistaceae bacterium]|jgi:hypothetical protein|nr:hypothetical protein [Synergistaceae bacterium]
MIILMIISIIVGVASLGVSGAILAGNNAKAAIEARELRVEKARRMGEIENLIKIKNGEGAIDR